MAEIGESILADFSSKWCQSGSLRGVFLGGVYIARKGVFGGKIGETRGEKSESSQQKIKVSVSGLAEISGTPRTPRGGLFFKKNKKNKKNRLFQVEPFF